MTRALHVIPQRNRFFSQFYVCNLNLQYDWRLGEEACMVYFFFSFRLAVRMSLRNNLDSQAEHCVYVIPGTMYILASRMSIILVICE